MVETAVPAVSVLEELVRKYDRPGPRYTSYPPATAFHEKAGAEAWAEELRLSRNGLKVSPVSLYVHVPFCESVCFYCGCNVFFTKNRERGDAYVERLEKELAFVAEQAGAGERELVQVHWGGGTPTFLAPDLCARLADAIHRHFRVAPDAELGVEVDPREATVEHLEALAARGFNRLSVGVQDFDPRVQEAVHRIQSREITQRVIEQARALGFKSVNMDLIYGLPFQTEATFRATLEQALALNPDRLAVFNLAYMPSAIPHQRALPAAALPAPKEKLNILMAAHEVLTGAGYRYIGMDHFALPDDELCRAQDDGTLYRNFQGYSTHADADLLGVGVSSISQIGAGYFQNAKDLASWERHVDAGTPTVFRGYVLNAEDLLRRDVITRLICHFRLDKEDVSRRHGISFDTHFGAELEALAPLREDGLVDWTEREMRIVGPGRFLIRNVCMAFDTHLARAGAGRFSRTV